MPCHRNDRCSYSSSSGGDGNPRYILVPVAFTAAIILRLRLRRPFPLLDIIANRHCCCCCDGKRYEFLPPSSEYGARWTRSTRRYICSKASPYETVNGWRGFCEKQLPVAHSLLFLVFYTPVSTSSNQSDNIE